MKTTDALMPAAILLLVSGTALAWPHGKADTDGDGAISKEEMIDKRLRMFGRLDADDNGYVTAEEMQAHGKKRDEKRRERRTKMMDKLDANGDGQISRGEMENAPLPLFDKADADGDGKLTREEMKAMRDKHRAGKSQ